MIHSPRIFLDHRLPRTWLAGLIKRYAQIFRARYMVERRMGLLLLLDQQNAVDRHLLFRGYWEQDRIDFLSSLIAGFSDDPRRKLFLDIGSHAALYALLMRRLGVFDRIVAFEPVPVNLAQLRANLMLNQIPGDIEVVEMAASDVIGSTEFLVENDRNRGMSRMVNSGDASPSQKISVATTTIDAHLPVRDNVLVVKIDVEGAELSVLRGMASTLQNNAVMMQIERNTGPVEDLTRVLEPYRVRYLRSLGHDHYFISESLQGARH
jgi:FkbM family methyltransferase